VTSENGAQIEARVAIRAGRAARILRCMRHGLTVIVAVAVIGGLTAGGIAALKYRAGQEAPPATHPPVAVATSPVAIQDHYRTTTRYVGRLEPARQTDLAFEQGGLVVEISVDEGDAVRAGEVIAQLDTQRLRANRRQLEAQMRELEAERTLAELTLNRQSSLREKGWTAQQREDEAVAGVARISAAIDRVAAQIALVDIDIGKSSLVASYDGTVGTRFVDEGAVAAAGAAVVTLLETGRPQARIGLPPEVAATLDDDRTYTIESAARTVPARLAAERPDMQIETGTVPVLFDLPAADGVPFREMVTLVVDTEVKSRGTWLPVSALTEGRKGLWSVMVVDGREGTARLKDESVEVIHLDGERAYVRGTFHEGERVVTNGTHRVVAGQQVALSGD
jgi:membrane fusion protein, multidrug efflux system